MKLKSNLINFLKKLPALHAAHARSISNELHIYLQAAAHLFKSTPSAYLLFLLVRPQHFLHYFSLLWVWVIFMSYWRKCTGKWKHKEDKTYKQIHHETDTSERMNEMQTRMHPLWGKGDHPSRLARDRPENLRQIPRPAFCKKCPANFLFHNIFNHFKF
jgi:hypothetical protein